MKVRLVLAALACALGVVVFATEPEPPVLSPASSSSVGTLFQDTFDDGDAAGWQEIDGSFSVVDGAYAITSSGFCHDARAINGTLAWTDYAIDVDFKIPAGGGTHAAILFRAEDVQPGCDAGRYYQFHIFASSVGFCRMNFSGGFCAGLADASYSVSTDQWHHARVIVQGSQATAFIDGVQVITYDQFVEYPAGRIGLKRINGGTALYDNVVVTSLETLDQDGDGFVPPYDCDDTRASVHPDATESCNGIDDDCDDLADEDSAGLDSDADGVHNLCDNCRSNFNPDQLDADGDLVGSACDNCITVVNPGQQDLDVDQRGDACDNCVSAYNPFQDDFDLDRLGDACDNCVFDFNPTQSNFDHDGQGDRCDLNDGLIYVFSTDPNYIEWQTETGPASWNVYEGDLAVLRSLGTYAQAPGSNPLAHRTCGVGQDYVDDFETPPNGAVKFSLVTGVTGGVEGSLGTNSAGAARTNANPCP